MCLSAGGADEQHRAGAELPAADQQHRQPVQPAAFLEHVQQVAKYKFLLTHTHTHTSTQAIYPNIPDVWSLSVGGTWR